MTIRPYDALRHAFFSVWRNLYPAFLISWPWMIVLAIVMAGVGFAVFRSGFGQVPLDPQQGLGAFLLAAFFGMAVYVAAFGSIAVNWHRYVLLDEVPQGGQRLRLDGHVRSYIWRILLAALIAIAVLFAPMMMIAGFFGGIGEMSKLEAGELSGRTFFLMLALQGVLAMIGGAVFFRSALSLPAAALGRYDIGIRESWRLTAGNTMPLAFIALGSWLLQIGGQLVMDTLTRVVSSSESTVGFSLLAAASIFLTWFLTFFGVTLLTSLYGYFVEHRQL